MSSLAVVDATVVRTSGRRRETIVIEDGIVTALLPPSEHPSADDTIEASGQFVIPGVIDPHVHLGVIQSFSDSCWNESRSAVTGGVTSMFHYLLGAASFLEVYDEHVAAVEERSLVDIGFHALIQNMTQVEEIPRTISEIGVNSYKFHMAMKGAEAAFGVLGVDDGMMMEGFRQVAAHPGALALVHAENIDVILFNRERMMAAHPDSTDIALWSEYRPAFTEEEAIVRTAYLAGVAGVPMGVVHTSVGQGPRLLAEAKIRHPHLYMETCPQYLVLHKDMPLGTWGKVNPPLRTEADQDLLWQALAAGTIDWMGSDHCDFDLATRHGNIWDVGPGLPTGMTMILPVMLSEGVLKGRLTLEQVVAVTSANWARIAGISPQKGTLEVGSDGDLVVLDMEANLTVDADVINSYADYTPFRGLVMKGWPRTTVASGEILYDRGEVNDTSTRRGKILRRHTQTASML